MGIVFLFSFLHKFCSAGRRHGRDRSLSPGTRRSWERSLDRFLHHFQRKEPAQELDAVAKRLPSQNSKPLYADPQDSPDSGATGNVVMGLS
jgi:hypothetical protein